jgi:hypothetical protein
MRQVHCAPLEKEHPKWNNYLRVGKEDAVSFIDWLQSLGIVISLIATVIQMSIYIKNLRMSIVTTISERNDALLQDIAAHSGVIKGFSKPFDREARNIFADPRVALMYRTLNFFDEMLYYHQQGYINKGTWELYQNTMRNFFTEKFARSFWIQARGEYNTELQQIVDRAISPNQ